MNPEICDRCRLKYSLFQCKNCQESFCSECDAFIHSILSKKDHIRKMIYSQSTYETITKLNLNYESKNNNKYKSKRSSAPSLVHNNISQASSNSNRIYDEPYNLTYDLNVNNNMNISSNEQDDYYQNENYSNIIPEKLILDSYRDKNSSMREMNKMKEENNININDLNEKYSNKKLNKNMSGFYINEIKNIYQCEKNELIAKINELSKELVDTKTNLGEHIDYLNNHIIQIESKYKDQIAELTLKNSNDLKLHTIKQDTRILELESELNVEKEKNEKLQKQLEEMEKTLKITQNNIEKLSDEKKYIDNAKKMSEERLNLKITNMEKSYLDEINKIKNSYETEKNKIKNELDASKMEYLKATENSKENMNKVMTERNKEKSFYDNVISKLKEEIANKNKENEQLKNMTRNLQYNNDELNETIIRLNNQINNKDMEQKSLLKAMNKMQKEKKEFERTNSKYHSVIYGRFKKKEGNKDY